MHRISACRQRGRDDLRDEPGFEQRILTFSEVALDLICQKIGTRFNPLYGELVGDQCVVVAQDHMTADRITRPITCSHVKGVAANRDDPRG